MSEMNHKLWLASSGVKSDIFPFLFLDMMINRFLRRSNYWSRYLQPQRQDDQVLVMLRGMLYSDSPFVEPVFRLRLMSRFGITIFLMNALMRPGVKLNCPVNRFFFQAFDRVKRCFLSPPDQIRRAITMLSNPFFQTPPFHLSFSIDGFSDWNAQFRFNIMDFLLLSIPADFAGLSEFLALVRDLIIAENPFWKSLRDVFIYHSLDQSKDDDDENDDERYCPDALQKLLTDIESSRDSKDLQEFARLFQHAEHVQVLVPNDLDPFLQVIERFLTYMIEILPFLPGIRFEDDVINFLPRTQLSAEGIVLSAMIRDKLKWVHSLKISQDLIKIIHNKNLEDSDYDKDERLVYRGFDLLLNLLKLIQESNGVIYTYIHACILIQTSTEPHKKRDLCALRDLFTIVTFSLNDERPETTRYDRKSLLYCSYLLKKEQSDLEKFLIECLLEPDFLKTLNDLLQCSDESDLEDFAQSFMKNLGLVRLFRRYIQENPKTWC